MQQHPARILRIPEILRRLGGLSRSWLYDRLDEKSPRYDPEFPKLLKLGPRSVGMLEEHLDAWIRSR